MCLHTRVHVCVCPCKGVLGAIGRAHVSQSMWSWGDNTWESTRPRNQTQGVRLGGKELSPTEQSLWPKTFLIILKWPVLLLFGSDISHYVFAYKTEKVTTGLRWILTSSIPRSSSLLFPVSDRPAAHSPATWGPWPAHTYLRLSPTFLCVFSTQ